jgi:CBS domain-containing protein
MTRVAELMSSPPISVDGVATLGDVASLLAERGIHVVVVLAGGAAAGVLSDTGSEEEVHRLVVPDPEPPDRFPLGIVSTADLVAEMAEPGSIWRDSA